jgi:protein-S-isoprenylcysteine O-methyltransferase Ste14
MEPSRNARNLWAWVPQGLARRSSLRGRIISSAPEGVDHRAGAVDANRRREDRQIDAGSAERRRSFAAAWKLYVPVVKSIVHNIGVVIVGLAVAVIGTGLDLLVGLGNFRSTLATIAGSLLLMIGFLVRVWATFYFYQKQMKVISLSPQRTLITSGPYRFSRNPLYLGGNVFVFLGAALLFGSPAAVFITVIHLPFVDLFIRREERQLERDFGEEWQRYRNQVRRWL